VGLTLAGPAVAQPVEGDSVARDRTRGHGTHSLPAVWGHYLADFMKEPMPSS
jgi:hypothetical protein